MSRLPGRYKNGGNASEAQLAKKLKDVLALIDKYMTILTENLIFSLETVLSENIAKAGSNARLSGYDEKIYEAYIQLINYYRQIITHYDENAGLLVSPGIKNISGGIYSVIKSRLNHYEDNTKFNKNPIADEKKHIMESSILYLSKACENIKKNFIAQKFKDTDFRSEFLKNINSEHTAFDFITKDKAFIEGINKLYSDSMKFCLNSLNDIEARKITKYYKELVDEESEILLSIIKIQVAALENESVFSGTEQNVIEKMVCYLKEAHQHFGKNVNFILSGFKETENNMEVLDSESICKYINSEELQLSILKASNCDNLKLAIQENMTALSSAVENELCLQAEKAGNITKIIYEQQKVITSHIFMADEMTDVFKNMLSFSEHSIANAQPGTNLDILKGISETMSIKIESIKENRQTFIDDCNKIIEAFRQGKPVLSKNSIAVVIPLVLNILFKIPIEDEKKASYLVKEKLRDIMQLEEFAGFRSKMDKYIIQFTEKINKKAIAFKKECLLFEITTFEEIINYSVSRLQESDDDEVLSFADCAYEGAIMLDIILKKNNIIPLKPVPHELFNGKEHEVLMAEKNSDYKKGEIIKLVNSGYKQDGIVIIRANVIAAK